MAVQVERPPTPGQRRCGEMDAEVLRLFVESGNSCGSPRIPKDLLEGGWTVSVNTVADSMRRKLCRAADPSTAWD